MSKIKNQNQNQNKEARVVIGVLAFFLLFAVITLILVILKVSSKKAHYDNSDVIIRQQQAEIARMEKEADIAAGRQGLIKMISGDIISINPEQQNFSVDIDPLGEHEIFEIKINNNTVFEKEEITRLNNFEQNTNSGEETENPFESKIINASYSQLEVGQVVAVYFAKRLDLNKNPELIAEKVVVSEYKE